MNIALMRDVLKHINEHPETHDQSQWHDPGATDDYTLGAWECGTTACVGGWATILKHGIQPERDEDTYYEGEPMWTWRYYLPEGFGDWMEAGRDALEIGYDLAKEMFLHTTNGTVKLMLQDLIDGVNEEEVMCKNRTGAYYFGSMDQGD